MKVSSSDDFSVRSSTLETDLSLSVSSWASDTVGLLSFPGRTRIGTVGSPFFSAGGSDKSYHFTNITKLSCLASLLQGSSSSHFAGSATLCMH